MKKKGEMMSTEVENVSNLTLGEYKTELDDLINGYRNSWDFKNIQKFRNETDFRCKLPDLSLMGLNNVQGLCVNKTANVIAALVALNDPRVQKAVWRYYDEHPTLRDFIFQYGGMQEDLQK